MGALDDPAPRLPGRIELACFDLFVAALDVRDHPALGDGHGDPLRAIAAIEAEPDLDRLGVVVGLGRLDDQRVEGGLKQLLIVPVGAGDRQTDRHPGGVAKDRTLGALLGSVGGIWARVRTPRGAPW